MLLVRELQSLTVTQRDHMLQGMPLSLAEKRCLRSVPTCLGEPQDPLPLGGGCSVCPRGGAGLVGGPGPDSASVPREKSQTPRGKRRGWRGHRGLRCWSWLWDTCVLVGAPGQGRAGPPPFPLFVGSLSLQPRSGALHSLASLLQRPSAPCSSRPGHGAPAGLALPHPAAPTEAPLPQVLPFHRLRRPCTTWGSGCSGGCTP